MWQQAHIKLSVVPSSKNYLKPLHLIPRASTSSPHLCLGATSPIILSRNLLLPSVHIPHSRHRWLQLTHAAASAGGEGSKYYHRTGEASVQSNDLTSHSHSSPHSSSTATGSHDPDEYHEDPPPPTAEEFCHWVIKGYDIDAQQPETAPSPEPDAHQIYFKALQTGLKISLAYCALGIILAKKTSLAVSVVIWQHLITTAKFCRAAAIKLWHLTVVTATFVGQVCSVVWAWMVKVWVLVSGVTTSAWHRGRRLVPVYARQARVKTEKFVPKSARDKWKEISKPDPAGPKKGIWEKIFWWWEHPVVKSVRITLSVANFGVRLPAIMALGTAVMTQLGLLTSQFTLPMLAPLLLGTGMLLQSVSTNASLLLPRFGLLMVLLWLIWVISSVIMNTWVILRRQGRLDVRTAAGLITLTETTALVVALIVLLSMVGVNISALLLPAAICMAFASRDLLSNMMAGLFLFIAQPFRIGDTVAVISSAPSQSPSSVMTSNQTAAAGLGGNWFQGECEKVDLRYTVLRQGKWRLMVPNASFILREFMVADNPDAPHAPTPTATSSADSDPMASVDQAGNAALSSQPRPMFLWPHGPDGSMPTASAWFFRVGPPPTGQPAPAAASQVPGPDPWNPAAGFSMGQYSFPMAPPNGSQQGSQLSVYASYEEVPPLAPHPSPPYTPPYPPPASPWSAPAANTNATSPPSHTPGTTPPPQPNPTDLPPSPSTPATGSTSLPSDPQASNPANSAPTTSFATPSAQASPLDGRPAPDSHADRPSAPPSQFTPSAHSTPPSHLTPSAHPAPHPQFSPSAHPPFPHPTTASPLSQGPNPLAFTSPSFPAHWLTSTHSSAPPYPSARAFQPVDHSPSAPTATPPSPPPPPPSTHTSSPAWKNSTDDATRSTLDEGTTEQATAAANGSQTLPGPHNPSPHLPPYLPHLGAAGLPPLGPNNRSPYPPQPYLSHTPIPSGPYNPTPLQPYLPHWAPAGLPPPGLNSPAPHLQPAFIPHMAVAGMPPPALATNPPRTYEGDATSTSAGLPLSAGDARPMSADLSLSPGDVRSTSADLAASAGDARSTSANIPLSGGSAGSTSADLPLSEGDARSLASPQGPEDQRGAMTDDRVKAQDTAVNRFPLATASSAIVPSIDPFAVPSNMPFAAPEASYLIPHGDAPSVTSVPAQGTARFVEAPAITPLQHSIPTSHVLHSVEMQSSSSPACSLDEGKDPQEKPAGVSSGAEGAATMQGDTLNPGGTFSGGSSLSPGSIIAGMPSSAQQDLEPYGDKGGCPENGNTADNVSTTFHTKATSP